MNILSMMILKRQWHTMNHEELPWGQVLAANVALVPGGAAVNCSCSTTEHLIHEDVVYNVQT
jgi:hypothetical protein